MTDPAECGGPTAGNSTGARRTAVPGRHNQDHASALTCVKEAPAIPSKNKFMWQSISTAPFDRDLELAVIDGDGPHALVFPCRRVPTGWIKSATKERIDISPTHWRMWEPAEKDV